MLDLELLVMVGIAALFIPKWLLLVSFVPPLMVLSFGDILPPIVSIGDADIRIFDVIIVIVGLRSCAHLMLRKAEMRIHFVYLAIGLFLSFLLVTTFIAYFRFGEDIFLGELIAFLRMVAQVSAVFLLAYSFETMRQIHLTHHLINCLGYVIAGSVYLAVALFAVGINFGEIQETENMVRYFGPLGDQVGFILLFFIIKQLLARNVLGAVVLAPALITTGTRGSLISLGIGLVVLLIYTAKKQKHSHGMLVSSVVFIGLCSAVLFFDAGGMWSRLVMDTTEPHSTLSSISQRMLTASIALRVAFDNLLTGVGYTGFRYVATEYGPEELFYPFWSPVFVATTGNQFLQVITDSGLLGLAIFCWMVLIILRTLHVATMDATDSLRNFLGAGYIWLLAILIGNQSAAWMLPGSLISYFLWLILGLAVASRLDLPPFSKNGFIEKPSLEMLFPTIPKYLT